MAWTLSVYPTETAIVALRLALAFPNSGVTQRVPVWSVPSCPGYKQGHPDLHSVAALLHQLHSHWYPPSEFGFPAEKDNRGFISCENPPLLTPGDNQPSCEIIKTQYIRCGGILSI